MGCGVSVTREFPRVANHVKQTQGVGCVTTCGRQAHKTVFARIGHGEQALPSVRGFGLCVFVDAGIAGTPSGPLPLGLRRQYRPFPSRVGLGIFNRDGDDGERAAPFDIGIRPAGVTPIRTRHVTPPLGWAALARQTIGVDKNHGPGQTHLGREFGMQQRIDHAFGHCFVSGRSNKGREVVVGDLGSVYPKP